MLRTQPPTNQAETSSAWRWGIDFAAASMLVFLKIKWGRSLPEYPADMLRNLTLTPAHSTDRWQRRGPHCGLYPGCVLPVIRKRKGLITASRPAEDGRSAIRPITAEDGRSAVRPITASRPTEVSSERTRLHTMLYKGDISFISLRDLHCYQGLDLT